MYYLEVSIVGKCGIEKGSSVINGSILIHQAKMVSSELNHVMLTMSNRNSEEAMAMMNKDFLGYTSHAEGDSIYIDSYKRGHGALKAFASFDVFLLYPLIAKDGMENFRLLARDKNTLENLVDRLGTGNNVERTIVKTLSLSEAFNNLFGTAFGPSLYGLTDNEIEIMKNAVRAGYYDWPRRGDLETISRQNNSSKVTTLYHIRKAEKKILEYVFRRNPELKN